MKYSIEKFLMTDLRCCCTASLCDLTKVNFIYPVKKLTNII